MKSSVATCSNLVSRKRKSDKDSGSNESLPDSALSFVAILSANRTLAGKQKSLLRVGSFGSFRSPSTWSPKSLTSRRSCSKTTAMKVGEALQRTWSGVKLSSSAPMTIGTPPPDSSLPTSPASSPGKSCSFSPPKRAPLPPCRPRGSRLWTETVAVSELKLSERDIQRQEAIFELYQGEEDMVEDLHLVKTAYYDSLRHLNIMTPRELQDIFGSMHTLAPLHQDLVNKLQQLRESDGTSDCIGPVLTEWIPGLTQYIAYCANQVHAKALLDEKKNHDKKLEDFLLRCLQSPFSRKLDLWNFLDVPRSRLVKYPILFRNILKLTPKSHPDLTHISSAITMVEDIIRKVDEKTGEAECNLIVSKLDYLEDKQKDQSIQQASVLLCSGVLRNTRGTKLSVFLFNNILVLTRPASRDHGLMYQVYRQPIPACQLVVEDLKDGEVKMGSFRNAFSHSQTAKNLFRVSFHDSSLGQAHTLQANDSHDKKQWLHNLCKVSCQSPPPPLLPSPVQPTLSAPTLAAAVSSSGCLSPTATQSPSGAAATMMAVAVASGTTTALLTACHHHHYHHHVNSNNTISKNTRNALNSASSLSLSSLGCGIGPDSMETASSSSSSSSPSTSSLAATAMSPLPTILTHSNTFGGCCHDVASPSATTAAEQPKHHHHRILRKRSSDNSLQVQSIEAACRGSLACIFHTAAETRTHHVAGHPAGTTLFV